MCGRYLIDDEAYADIWEILNSHDFTGLNNDMQPLSAGEVFPSAIAPVYEKNSAAVVKWGFPHWKNSSLIINARSETALEKNMFHKPLRERRCVIPSSGFYEWSRSGRKTKDKYLLRKPGEHMLYMAGMVSTFRDAMGVEYTAFVILTTAANESVAPIHDRMPVILAPDEVDLWTSDDGFMEYTLLRPGPELLAERTVTTGGQTSLWGTD